MTGQQKKAVIFMGPLSSGGAEKQALLLAKALQNDLDITVVSYYGNVRLQRMVEYARIEGIRVEYLSGSTLRKVWVFNGILKRIKPDIMFMYLPSNNLIGGLLGRFHGVKKLFGGVRTSRLPKFHFRILLVAHNFINHLTIFNNRNGFNHLTALGFKPEKGVVIHNCFHPFSDPMVHPTSDIVTILTCARFEHFKDYESAIAAFKSVLDRTTKVVRFRIVGTGNMKEQVLRWIHLYGVADHVDIIENPEDVDVHYREADIYLCSSSYEGLSNSVLEAMNRCLPVVSTRVGDHGLLAIDDKTGFLVEVGDRNAIADRLLRLAECPDLRNKLGANGHQLLVSQFSMKKFREHYLSLINTGRP
jgi:glycosyltransferase involved in cell wall biosynthesis